MQLLCSSTKQLFRQFLSTFFVIKEQDIFCQKDLRINFVEATPRKITLLSNSNMTSRKATFLRK
jgi:hypothetical protein